MVQWVRSLHTTHTLQGFTVMASRWMAAKLAKMARDRKRDPVMITLNRAGHTTEMADRVSRETAEIVSKFNGVTTVGVVGRPLRAIGKTRREFDGRTFGDGRRRGVSAADYYGLWATGDVLIHRQ